MFGFGGPELLVILAIVVPIYLIYYFGFVSGKNKGIKQGLDYSKEINLSYDKNISEISPENVKATSKAENAQAMGRTQTERLRELSKLRDEGLISDEEFKLKKKEILDGI